jgi:PAS domain S-box-containing protein
MSSEVLTILLIEDNPGDARLVGEYLSTVNRPRMNLESADGLTTGVERAQGGGVDAILLDLGLPETQGLESLFQLKSRIPPTPIVVLTGLDDESVGLHAVRRGAQDYLVKDSLDSIVLARCIQYAIERHRLRTELEKRTNALHTTGHRLRKIAEVIGDGIVVVSQDGKIRFTNPAAEQMLGRKSHELRGSDFGHPVKPGETKRITVGLDAASARDVDASVVALDRSGGQEAYLVCMRAT